MARLWPVLFAALFTAWHLHHVEQQPLRVPGGRPLAPWHVFAALQESDWTRLQRYLVIEALVWGPALALLILVALQVFLTLRRARWDGRLQELSLTSVRADRIAAPLVIGPALWLIAALAVLGWGEALMLTQSLSVSAINAQPMFPDLLLRLSHYGVLHRIQWDETQLPLVLFRAELALRWVVLGLMTALFTSWAATRFRPAWIALPAAFGGLSAVCLETWWLDRRVIEYVIRPLVSIFPLRGPFRTFEDLTERRQQTEPFLYNETLAFAADWSWTVQVVDLALIWSLHFGLPLLLWFVWRRWARRRFFALNLRER